MTQQAFKHKEAVTNMEKTITSLSNFEEEREQIQQRIRELEEQLRGEKEGHEEFSNVLEMSVIREKEKLRNQLKIKIQEETIRIETENRTKLSMRARMTMEQNDKLMEEMKTQEKEAHKMLDINKRVLEETRELRNKLSLSLHSEGIMTKKLALYRRLLERQSKKLQFLSENGVDIGVMFKKLKEEEKRKNGVISGEEEEDEFDPTKEEEENLMLKGLLYEGANDDDSIVRRELTSSDGREKKKDGEGIEEEKSVTSQGSSNTRSSTIPKKDKLIEYFERIHFLEDFIRKLKRELDSRNLSLKEANRKYDKLCERYDAKFCQIDDFSQFLLSAIDEARLEITSSYLNKRIESSSADDEEDEEEDEEEYLSTSQDETSQEGSSVMESEVDESQKEKEGEEDIEDTQQHQDSLPNEPSKPSFHDLSHDQKLSILKLLFEKIMEFKTMIDEGGEIERRPSLYQESEGDIFFTTDAINQEQPPKTSFLPSIPSPQMETGISFVTFCV